MSTETTLKRHVRGFKVVRLVRVDFNSRTTYRVKFAVATAVSSRTHTIERKAERHYNQLVDEVNR